MDIDAKKKSPVKVVRWELGSDDENVNETNIVVNIKAKSPSPRKKRRPSSTTEMLEAELKAEARRRSSLAGGALIDNENLSQMVSSLRRQNEDLRSKLLELQHGSASTSSSSLDRMLIEQKEKGCDDMRTTIDRLERLLALEREERSENEKKTLELLGNVKAKWHNRDEQRLQKLHAELDLANTVVKDMELELHKARSDLETAQEETTVLQTVKGSLKAKLKECKSKLEVTVANYDAKCETIACLEKTVARLEMELADRKSADVVAGRRASIAVREVEAEITTLREDASKTEAKKREVEAELHESRTAAKTLGARVEAILREKASLQKEHDEHVSKCDALLVKLRGDADALRDRNADLESKVATSNSKLASKTKDLARLENVLEELEHKIPSKERLTAMADAKADEKLREQSAAFEELQQNFSLQKIELRIAEKKLAEQKERLDFVRAMYIEEKKKREAMEKVDADAGQSLAKAGAELEAVRRDAEELREKNATLVERVEANRKEIVELKRDAAAQEKAGRDADDLRSKLKDAESKLKESADIRRKYDLTRNVCLELEDQAKEYEAVIAKLEESLESGRETNAELKRKADESSGELLKARREINELKSTKAFKETRIRDLEEKNKEVEKFYESEGAMWKTKFEESTRARKEQTTIVVDLTDRLARAESERDRDHEENGRLYEANNKLKEEMSTLITSIHSLKESNLMLQTTVQELADKLSTRDAELERRSETINRLEEDLERKTVEHKETLNQLKKLTLHLPPSTPNSKKNKDKHTTNFLL